MKIMTDIIQLIGSLSILCMGIISVNTTLKQDFTLLNKRLLLLIGMDLALVSMIRLLNTPLDIINSQSVTIITGMIGLVFLIFVLMEVCNNKHDIR